MLSTYVPIGHGSFDGRDDGREEIDGDGEGHVPKGMVVSSAVKSPPSLIRTESNITV